MYLVFHRPDLQALNIGNRADGTLTVGQIAKAILHPRQAADPFGLQQTHDVLTDFAVKHGIDMLLVSEEEGEVKKKEPFLESAHRPRGTDIDIDRPKLKSLDEVAFAGTQLVVREDVDKDVAVGLCLDQLLKLHRSEVVGVFDGHGMSELQRKFGSGFRQRDTTKKQHKSHQKNTAELFHKI